MKMLCDDNQREFTKRCSHLIKKAFIELFVVWVALFSLSNSLGRGAEAAGLEDFEKEIKKINEEATALKNIGDLEKLATKQNDRESLIAKQFLDNPDADNIWLQAAKALVKVDGNLKDVEFEKQKPGLVDQCKYQEAIQVLEALWKSFDKDPDVVLPGHVATRIFEIVNQAEGIHRGVMDKESPYFMISEESVRQYLQEARDHDPCCILAAPMMYILDRGDPSEVFLRAEVRPNFKKRQDELAELSHPAARLEAGNTVDGGVPVAEWHGPVELCKAESLRQLIGDLDLVKPLAGGLTFSMNGTATPKTVLMMKDASSADVAMIYGFLLSHNARDAKGNMRTALSLVDETRGLTKLQWESHYLELLWKKPPPIDSDNKKERAADASVSRLLSSFPEVFDFVLDGEEYAVLRVPSGKLEDLVRVDPSRLMIRDLYRFKQAVEKPYKMGYAPTTFFKQQEELLYKKKKTQFATTKTVDADIRNIEFKKDRTKHPLASLLEKHNPIMLLSTYDGGNRQEEEQGKRRYGTTPNWLIDENGQKYLKAQDGAHLVFEADPDLGKASFTLSRGETVTHMPMTLNSVDLAVYEATPFGQVVSFLLNKAGYTGAEKLAEFTKVVENYKAGRFYWPSRYKTLARAKGSVRGEQNDGHEQLCQEAMKSLFDWQPNYEWVESYYTGFLDSQGSEKKTCLSDLEDFYDMFQAYGLRSLRDPRNRLITNRRMTNMTYVKKNEVSEQLSENQPQYAFDIWSSDGEDRVSLDQIYSWQDYEQLKENIYYEHLSKMLMLHPSPAGLAIIKRDSRNELKNPIEGDSLNITFQEEEAEKKAAADKNEAKADLREPALVDLTQYVDTERAAGNLLKGFDKALNQLSSGYSDLYKTLTKAAHSINQFRNALSYGEQRLASLNLIIVFAGMRDGQGSYYQELKAAGEQLAEQQRQENQQLRAGLAGEIEGALDAQNKLVGILHRSARALYNDKYYHRSIIFFNDILDVDKLLSIGDLAVDSLLEIPFSARGALSGAGPFGFFLEVATTEKADRFIKDVAKLITTQLYQVQVQLELAKALAKSDFKDSAVYLIDHVEQSYEWCLKPAVDLSEEYVTAYGLTFSNRMKQALEDMESLIQAAAILRNKIKVEVDWKNLAVGQAAGAAFKKLVADVQANIQKESPDTSVNQKLLARLAAQRVTLEEWLEAKSILKVDEDLFTAGEYEISPLDFCPVRYDQENGFIQDPITVFESVSVDQVLAYCGGKALGNLEQECAAAFIIAWYWMDSERPEPAKARAAFVEAARKYRELKNEKNEKSLESFVNEYQSYLMFLGAVSMLADLPGISKHQTEFSEGLLAQVYVWQKEWFAEGYVPIHATVVRRKAELALKELARVKEELNDGYQNDRYYFPDYRFWESSFLPDNVVARMIARRKQQLIDFADEAKKPGPDQNGADPKEPIEWFNGPEDIASFWSEFSIPKDVDFIKE